MSKEKAKKYLSSNEIPQLFECLMTGLMYNRPDNHIGFLQDCLSSIQEQGTDAVKWNLFLTKDNTRASFSQGSPLPAIGSPKSESKSEVKERDEVLSRASLNKYSPLPPVQKDSANNLPPVIFIMGGPESGRKKLCEGIAEKYTHWTHLSMGSLLMELSVTDAEEVPEEEVVRCILQRLNDCTGSRSVIVDGFPRSLRQAQLYEEQGGSVEKVFLIDCNYETMICGNQKNIIERVQYWKEESLATARYYDLKGILTVLDGEKPNTQEKLQLALEGICSESSSDSQPQQSSFDRKESDFIVKDKILDSDYNEISNISDDEIEERTQDLGKNGKLVLLLGCSGSESSEVGQLLSSKNEDLDFISFPSSATNLDIRDLKKEIEKKLSKCKLLFIEGCTKSVEQLQTLNDEVGEVSLAFLIDCSNELLTKRLAEGPGSEADANESLQSWKENTLPVVRLFDKKEKLIIIDGDQDLNSIAGDIDKAVQFFKDLHKDFPSGMEWEVAATRYRKMKELDCLWNRLNECTDAKSLLKTHLTEDVYEKLKYKKTSIGGYLNDCIISGALNLDSGCGVYACDPEGYDVFSDLLFPVIADYHKVEGGAEAVCHPEPDFGDLDNLEFGSLDPENKYIVSTRIRVGRSHQGKGFPPILTKEDRLEMEKCVKNSLEKLSDEHAGTYYPLLGMEKETEKNLVDDHFLFKDDDRFLKSAGGYDDWPYGRGIYHNKDKTFLVWVNEEDHLRIISMQKGGDVGEVYRRLVKGVRSLENSGLQFAKHPRLGYITFCPTNLGTTLRASVHVRIPWLSSQPLFKSVCSLFNLQPRGIHGEHTESVGGIFDLSNKRRLGLTEYNAVKEMCKGVSEIIEMEKQNKIPDDILETINRNEIECFWQRLSSAKNCKSLLKKHLSQNVFDDLKDKKTSIGGRLNDCIRSGAINLDSGCGVYACDPEAYSLFAPLLIPVVADYHRVVGDVKHPSPNFGDLDKLEFGDLDPDNKFIVSTRIRVARSHEGKGFPPILTKDERLEMESDVKEALSKFSGEHSGSYYPLLGMDKLTEKNLVDDHFLFKDDDRFLQSAGGYDDWPYGRGIFHNNDKTFLVWVNEEDHLRIISMQMGGNVGDVYKRLVRGINSLESSGLSFAKHPDLGYLTFCPTNLGTTLRASVHVKIPWFSSQSAFKSVCSMLNLQPRGIHGEHTESVGGVYDVSNKRRLGLTEYDAVKEMCAGVSTIIEIEKAQAISPEILEATKRFELNAMWQQLCNAQNCNSLLKKHLTEEVFDNLKHLKTSIGGYLNDCIISGATNLDSGCGLYACDPEAYDVFSELFFRVIADYHSVEGGHEKVQHPEPDFGTIEDFEDLDPDKEYIVSTRIRVGRSHSGKGFPPILSKQERISMENDVVKALKQFDGEHEGSYYPLLGMDEDTERKLVDDHFLFKNDDRFLKSAGGYDDWPYGRGIFHNDEKTFLVWVNEEDHLRIISMQKHGNVGEVYRRLVKGVQKLEKLGLQFAKHTRLGYLTFCPTNLGTTLRASVHIRIPWFSSQPEFKDICSKLNLQPRGIHGEHTESVGGVYDVSNKRRLGLTEYAAVKEMCNGIKTIIEIERSKNIKI